MSMQKKCKKQQWLLMKYVKPNLTLILLCGIPRKFQGAVFKMFFLGVYNNSGSYVWRG